MQAFFCEASRALMKFGIAIAASKPMIATTIMISTNVNALRREVLSCIYACDFLLFKQCEQKARAVYHNFGCSLNCPCQTVCARLSNGHATIGNSVRTGLL